MKALIPILILIFGFATKGQELIPTDLKKTYQDSIYGLILPLYRKVAVQSNLNFVYSARSIWLMIGAIAEGSNEETKQQLFQFLNVTNDSNLRQQLYQVGRSRDIAAKDVNIIRTRTLLFDEGLTINRDWQNYVTKNSLLEVSTAPIKSCPCEALNYINSIMGADIAKVNWKENSVLLDSINNNNQWATSYDDAIVVNLNGNSVFLDSFYYNVKWATSFDNAIAERAPFYDQGGKQIGAVDLMKTKQKVRMGYVKSINAKALELPVGSDGKYRMIFYMLLDNKGTTDFTKNIKEGIIFEVIDSLKQSNVAIDIAIPRLEISNTVDVRSLLEDFGVKSIWTNPEATKGISTPPALPSAYLQRTTISFDKKGVAPASSLQSSPPGTPTGLDPKVGTDFIANRPFLFGLFDAETYTPLMTAGFSKPTYL